MGKLGLTREDYQRAADRLGCEVAAIKAVDQVESRGNGFIANENDPHVGEPVILFERHIFAKLTQNQWSNVWSADAGRGIIYLYRDISYYRPGGYGPTGGHQHERLAKAAALDRNAALQSASWGRYQIMGFNYPLAGFDTLQAFINAMYESEARHLDAFVAFCISKGLDKYLRNHRWSAFAEGYNGRDYKKNKYDTKLSAGYKQAKKEGW